MSRYARDNEAKFEKNEAISTGRLRAGVARDIKWSTQAGRVSKITSSPRTHARLRTHEHTGRGTNVLHETAPLNSL